jgi:hypothetical protein
LKAFSWATFGTAAHEAGDVAAAVPAFQTAVEQGAFAPWISNDLRAAKTTLGARQKTNLSVEYLGSKARMVTEMLSNN